MANPFSQHETYDEEIVDPRDDERWSITLRELNAGDDAAIRDETVIEIEENDAGQEIERQRVPMGRLRLLAVERAIVSWTMPLPLSPNAIRALNSDIFDQIYAKVRFASASPAKEEEGPPTEAPTGDPSPEPSVEPGS